MNMETYKVETKTYHDNENETIKLEVKIDKEFAEFLKHFVVKNKGESLVPFSVNALNRGKRYRIKKIIHYEMEKIEGNIYPIFFTPEMLDDRKYVLNVGRRPKNILALIEYIRHDVPYLIKLMTIYRNEVKKITFTIALEDTQKVNIRE
jgi:hypothetical protein